MPEQLRELRRTLWMFAIATCAMFLVAVGVGAFAYVANSHRINENSKTAVALCAIRHDRIDEVQRTERFLASHPHGIPGIAPALLVAQLNEQRKTVEALAILHCDQKGER